MSEQYIPQNPKQRSSSYTHENQVFSQEAALPRVQDSDGFENDLLGQYLRDISRNPLLSAEDEVVLSKNVEAGLAADRIRILRGCESGDWLYSGLEPAVRARQEAADAMLMAKSNAITDEELAQLSLQGSQAKARFIEANLRLVVSIVKKGSMSESERLDRIQDGSIGLVRAVEKFDYRKGYKFSTYGTWWIRQAILRGMADRVRTIHVPIQVHDEIGRMIRVRREIVQKTQHDDPSPAQIADKMGISPDRVRQLIDYNRSPLSLSWRPEQTGRGSEIGELIVDAGEISLDEQLHLTTLIPAAEKAVKEGMGGDGDICWKAFRLYYGLDGEKPISHRRICAELNLSRRALERIMNAGAQVLRDHLRQSGYQDLFD